MNDVKDLLEIALTDGCGPGPEHTVDPADDLARGRALLRRRRVTRVAGTGVAVAGVAAVLVGVTTSGSPAARPAVAIKPPPATTPASPSASASARAATHRSIALVSYTGKQVPGYRVAKVPRGWVVQGGNAFALVVAPLHDKDTDIDSFLGKITVMLKSVDEPVPVHAKHQPVAGRPGYVRDQGITWTLTYKSAAGSWVDIQVPTSLGWKGPRLARFAAGVEVLGNAQPGHG